MTNRTVMILAAVLAALVLVILVNQRSDQTPGTEPAGLLIPELSARLDDVDAVTVTKGGGTVVATLSRDETGWVVPERNNYPADVSKLRAGLLALAAARRIEQKTANPAFYDRLGVEPVEGTDANGALISIGGLGEQPIQVIIGDAAGSDYRYVRLNSDATSWLIDRDPEFPRATGEWLSADLLDVDGDRVQAISVSHPGGERVEIRKDKPDQADFTVQNIPDGRELLYKGVANAMGDVLEKLSLEDVEPAGADSNATAIVTEFRTFDGLVITVTSVDRDDAGWVHFAAGFDPTQAAAFAAQPLDDTARPVDTGAGTPTQPAAEVASDDNAVALEAQQINDRLSGWRYKITGFKFEQLTRNMDDLLQAPADQAG